VDVTEDTKTQCLPVLMPSASVIGQVQNLGVQLRYSFRLYPTPGQRQALARAFGCARTVYNDGLRARETARAAGLALLSSGELSKRVITEAKKTPERMWLGEVSAVVLQQSLRDLDAAYRNFFDGLKGERSKMGPPRYKSRKDTRQAVRFTANARWQITEGGKLRLPKIGDVPVKWSRSLPSTPSSVTVVKDSAGRYFASFVIDTVDEPLPQTPSAVGVDLGLTHFAILSDGTKVDSPAFPAARGEETQEGPEGPFPQEEGIPQPGQGTPEGRTRSREGHRRAPRLPSPTLHQVDPREPSGRRGRPCGEGAGAH